MRILFTDRSYLYRSPFEVWNGDHDEHHETPERVETILNVLKADSNFVLTRVDEVLPTELLEKVHIGDYIQFLRTSCEALAEEEYRYPSVFALHSNNKKPINQLARQGYYTFDMYTPLLHQTFQSAVGSASLAWRLAQEIQSKDIKVGYAACRPPGHHAEPAQMGGYCYINNAAVAAEYFSAYGKVAVLDVDFHHGNGTQHIFYERADVLTISLHADPAWKFPYFSGFADEIGSGMGEGTNMNIPLKSGTTNNQFQYALETACEKIQEFRPEYLVVAFGADTFVGDPIGGFALTTTYFQKMAETIAKLNLPTAIVQEGGYNCEELGINVRTFLSGFE